MRRVEPHLLVNIDMAEVGRALADWDWRIGASWTPIAVSTAGDVFISDALGRIARLDTGSAELKMLANSAAEFEAACEDPATTADWFLVPVLVKLRASGKTLGPRQCYEFTILPIFKEGSYAAHNRFALDAAEHIRVTAHLHRQVEGLKDGDRVSISVVP